MCSTSDLVTLAVSLQCLMGLCDLFGLIRSPATRHLNNVTSAMWRRCLAGRRQEQKSGSLQTVRARLSAWGIRL